MVVYHLLYEKKPQALDGTHKHTRAASRRAPVIQEAGHVFPCRTRRPCEQQYQGLPLLKG